MTDVARIAGVSHQTVSRVLNDHPSVSEQTRLRVQAAIAELGYRRNHAARTLVTGRSQLIGVVAQNSTLFGPASMLSAVEQTAGEAGFAVSVGSVRSLDRRAVSEATGRLARPAGRRDRRHRAGGLGQRGPGRVARGRPAGGHRR